MHALTKRPLMAACLLLAGGCGGFVEAMPTWVELDEASDDALVLLAVTPPASVVLAVGRMEGAGWRPRGPSSRVTLSGKDGFVLAKVAPSQGDRAYAVVEARPESCATLGETGALSYATAFWSPASPASDAVAAASPSAGASRACPAYAPGEQARLPVFPATAGRVTFVGTLALGATRDAETDGAPRKLAVAPAPAGDLEAARRFMAERYPRILARIVPGSLEMVRLVR